jgi:hypothetical protein
MAAATQVLQNFELLEAILLHSETYEICIATAVCTAFRAVVENSKTLRAYILTIPIRKPLLPHKCSGYGKAPFLLNSTATGVWHFAVKTADKGSLFITRIPSEGVEVILLAPRRAESHLKVLDDAYNMYAVTTDFRPDLEFRTKTGEKVCRTKCKAPKVTHPRHMHIARRSDHPGAVYGQILRNYLSTFYADEYGPGVRLRYTAYQSAV